MSEKQVRDERRQRRHPCEWLASAIRAGDPEAALALLEGIGKQEVLDAKVAISSSTKATWGKSRRGRHIVSNNDTAVTSAAGITAPVRPFIYIGDRVVVTISSPKVPILHLAAIVALDAQPMNGMLAYTPPSLLIW